MSKDGSVHFRAADKTDLPSLIEMLASDPLGASRETIQSSPHPAYVSAFNAIQSDPNNEIIVAVSNGMVAGMLQITFVQYLTHSGSSRATIEGVRIHQQFRGEGIGEKMLRHAIDQARAKGCGIVQLTTDKSRPDAIRFYQKLGFVASHEGMKLKTG